MKNKEPLTRKYLESIGVKCVDFGSDGWTVTRRWKSGSGGVIVSTIRPRPNNGSLSITVSIGGKAKVFSVARFVYAWHIGDVPGDMEVCYLDGDPKNVSLPNLVVCDQKTANAMRRRTQEEKQRDAASRETAAVKYGIEAKKRI